VVDQAKSSKATAAKNGEPHDLRTARLYINRELSNLEYFSRILEQAKDSRHPLLERVRFLSMVSVQIDEFFMVRVSDVEDQLDQKLVEIPPDGMTPAQQLTAIRRKVTSLFQEQHKTLQEGLLPELDKHNIRIIELRSLSTSQRAALRPYFDRLEAAIDRHITHAKLAA